MSEPSIKTTVVGSYPVPSWLHTARSGPALRDAIMVVLKTQELAGLDVIVDGELSRFDVNHPETNGMIDYFIRPLSGVSTDLTRAELDAFRAQEGMGFRAKPAGIVREKLGEGSMNLLEDWESVKNLTDRPLKFTVTAPYMLAKTLANGHYADHRALCMDLAEVLAKQVAEIDAPVVQVDEANLTGHPEDVEWAHEPINIVLDAIQGEKACTFASATTAARAFRAGSGKTLFPF